MIKVNDNLIVCRDSNTLFATIVDPIHINAITTLASSNTDITIGQLDGGIVVSIPNNLQSCRLLNNMGIDTTLVTPFVSQGPVLIEGKYKPMAHQTFTASFVTLNPRCYVLNDPRTGKTGSLVIATDYLQRHKLVKGGFLIITTLTTIRNVWQAVINQTLPNDTVKIVHGKDREQALLEPADYYITNYDSCRLSEPHFIKAVNEGRIGGIIIDELTHVGNSTSKRFKSINNIANKTGLDYVIGLTGSPVMNPETVFGMCKMINPNALPCTTKTGWLDLITKQYGSLPHQRVVKQDTPEIIKKTMRPSVRFNKHDILDLPPVVTQDRFCELSKEQIVMREQFRSDYLALTESGEVITAANGGVLYQKLMQVAQGFVTNNDGKPVYLEHKDRTATLIDIVEESANKVVIFCVYHATIAKLSEDLKAKGYAVGVVHGGVTGEKRSQILHDFQNTDKLTVLICHPVTTAYGVELAAADTMVFNGPPPLGNFIYAQALERLSSAKQKASSISVIRVMSSPEEVKFFKALDKGQDMGNFINKLFEDFPEI